MMDGGDFLACEREDGKLAKYWRKLGVAAFSSSRFLRKSQREGEHTHAVV